MRKNPGPALALALTMAGLCAAVPARTASGPLSVVFLIDNSEIMATVDPGETRFGLVSALLDTLYAVSPETEVGLIPFTRRLLFDDRDGAFFESAFPGDTSQHDAFVPLTRLDGTYAAGRTGLDTLKQLLTHSNAGALTHATGFPASRYNDGMGPMNLTAGTDITLGFAAAKLAMSEAKNPKERQVVIFLSDGVPISLDRGREATGSDYIKGTGLPRTMTVYFPSGSETQAPADIRSMSENIKANGYSAGNDRGGIWMARPSASVLLESIAGLLEDPVSLARSALTGKARKTTWKSARFNAAGKRVEVATFISSSTEPDVGSPLFLRGRSKADFGK